MSNPSGLRTQFSQPRCLKSAYFFFNWHGFFLSSPFNFLLLFLFLLLLFLKIYVHTVIIAYLYKYTPEAEPTRPVHLYLIFEKSSKKNKVGRTGFLVYFELDFYCLCSLQKSISKLIFAGRKSSLWNLIVPTWFFKIQVQINRGSG